MKFKKYLMIFIVAVIVVVLVGYLTLNSYGFFSTNDVKKNTFALGKTIIDLTEPNWDSNKNPGNNLLPGSTIIKDPTLIGVEGNSFSRVILEFLDEDGNLITNQARIDLIKQTIYYDTSYNGTTTSNLVPGIGYTLLEIEQLRLQGKVYNLYNLEKYALDITKSTYNTYYFTYNSILIPGDKAVLFSNIAVPLDFANEEIELLGKFKLQLRAEAVQIEGFNSRADAFSTLDMAVNP